MKKIMAIFLTATSLVSMCVPALSGCGGESVKFTLSEEGGKHYIVSYSGYSSPTGEYEIPAYFGEGKDYAPVTEIADEGFAGTSFSKIIVPGTVTKIGVMAFGYCHYLETVEFAEGINIDKFSNGMFGNSEKLQQIQIPDSVTTLDGAVFSGCTSLSLVDLGSVESIGARAFASCTALEEIVLPDTLTTIGVRAFYKSGLKSVEIPDSVKDIVKPDEEGGTVYGIGYGAFDSCLNLVSAKIGGGVAAIPSGAFGNCVSLEELHIPLSVKEIQGVYLENFTPIFGHAFYYDEALRDIYYEGSEEQWKEIKIDYSLYESYVNNDALKNARKHYNNK